MGSEIAENTKITITYRTQSNASDSVQVPPQTFFEMDESTEGIESIHDLVWEHNHASDYLGIKPEQLVETSIEVACEPTGERIVDTELFWNQGTCRTILRREYKNNSEVYWLQIIEIKTPQETHFIRLGSESREACCLLEHHALSPDEALRVLFPECKKDL